MTPPRALGGRRAAYRVVPESLHELDMALLEKRYKLIRATVTDIAIGGALVHFAQNSIPPLAAGDRVMLALASDRYDFDGTLWARIVSIGEDASAPVLRVSFDLDDAGLRPAQQAFFALFNRRAIYRAHAPEDRSDLTATLASTAADGAQTYPAMVRNLSNIGACVALDAVTDSALMNQVVLLLALKLPAAAGTHLIPCQTRRRVADANGITYGLEFDWSKVEHATCIAQDLIAYVLARSEALGRIAPDRRVPRS